MTRAGRGDATGCGRFEAPRPALGLVFRSEALERLTSSAVRVGVITAPAGYGKTSHAGACAARDHRRVAWIDAEEAHATQHAGAGDHGPNRPGQPLAPRYALVDHTVINE